MRLFRILFLVLASCCTASVPLWGQTMLSGVLNNLTTTVSSFNVATNSMDLVSSGGFSVGDTVLVIQMKGATINEADAATFGDVTAIGNAGKYEFAVICDITGNTVTFDQTLLNTYTAPSPTSHVQVILVPTYTNVVVNGTLTENAWNGTTGGVLVFAATGWVKLSADIDMAGKGFKAGWDYSNYGPCGCGCAAGGGPQFPAYYYPTSNCRAASKGEGIADTIATKEFGRGKQANGGGGGNDHNSGGAGGGNYGAGGLGGIPNNQTCAFFGAYCRGFYPGVGGLSFNSAGFLGTSENRIFLGGGGGAGHDNNGTGTAGARGGGIVIILADSLDLNGFSVSARGNSQTTAATSDGAGGGGAGGTLVMDVRSLRNTAGTLNVQGGNGGTDNWGAVGPNCKGPGGGGGGGVIWTRAAIPGSVTTSLSGGLNGTNCTGAASSTPGGAGGTITGLVTRLSTVNYTNCDIGVAPVEWGGIDAFAGKDFVDVEWNTYQEVNNNYFEIERSQDGVNFFYQGQVPSLHNTYDRTTYNWRDEHPLYGRLWYRIRQIDFDGRSGFSPSVLVSFTGASNLIKSLAPNPVNGGQTMFLQLGISQGSTVQVMVTDVTGRVIIPSFTAPSSVVEIPTQQLRAGIYFLQAISDGSSETMRFIVNE